MSGDWMVECISESEVVEGEWQGGLWLLELMPQEWMGVGIGGRVSTGCLKTYPRWRWVGLGGSLSTGLSNSFVKVKLST